MAHAASRLVDWAASCACMHVTFLAYSFLFLNNYSYKIFILRVNNNKNPYIASWTAIDLHAYLVMFLKNGTRPLFFFLFNSCIHHKIVEFYTMMTRTWFSVVTSAPPICKYSIFSACCFFQQIVDQLYIYV